MCIVLISTSHPDYALVLINNRDVSLMPVALAWKKQKERENNLTSTLTTNSQAYDDKKNPFSQTPPNNYYFMYVGFKDPSTHINNAVVKNADTYNYTYNAAGFPTKAIVDNGTATFPIYYNYIVK